jgi:hypothetical protein
MHSPAQGPVGGTPRPEQTFFADPAIDRALGVVMALATEVYVLRDRLGAVERQLAERGSLDVERLNAEPAASETAARNNDCDAFVAHIMSSVLGVQASQGATT